MIKQVISLLLCLFIGTAALMAQDVSYRFINFNYKDGLQDKFFYDVVNDKSGMIWIAAGSGLYNYNGSRFTLYRPQNKQTGEEFSNLMRSIYVDANGYIWAAGLNSLQWFNPVNKKFFYPLGNNNSLKQLGNAVINKFFSDSEGNMWVATQKKGVALLSKKDTTAVFYKASEEPGASSNFITRIIETPHHLIWALSVDGIHLLKKDQGIIQTFRNKRKGHNHVDDNFFTDGFYDEQMNCIWIASSGSGIVKFDLETKKGEYFDIVSESGPQKTVQNIVTVIAKKSGSDLWFYNGNLSVFNKYTHKVTTEIKPEAGNEYGFKSTGLGKIYSDTEGNLWFSSFNGLSMLPWQNNQWRTILLNDKADNNTLLEPTNVCRIPETNNLFIATTGAKGIGYYDSAANNFRVVKISKNAAATTVHVFNNKVYAAVANDIFLYNNSVKKFEPLYVKYNNQSIKGPVWRIMNDGKESLIIVSPQDGFYTYNLASGKTTHFNVWDIDPSINKSEIENTIWPSLTDSKGNTWFTRSKFLYYSDKQKIFHKVAYKDNDGQQSIIQPYEIAEDATHHYWVTTKTNGIYEWYINEQGKEVIHNYSTSNTTSLPSDYFIRILKDEQGMLWLGSLSGLVKFDPFQKKVISVFRKKHGLSNDNIDVPLSMLPGNKLVISNFGALNLLNINDYKINKLAPITLISSFKVMDKAVLLPSADTTIVLPYNQNFLQFELAALSYNNSDENRFAYKLEGVDRDWMITGRNYVSYSSLGSGTYLFKSKSANNDQTWSTKDPVLKIIIRPPFWKTWWFITLLVFAFATATFLFNQNRVLQIRKEEKLKAAFKQQIAETELKALRAQMNPHFIFNSLNSIQKYILKNEHYEASQYLTKFSRLIRLILDLSNENNIILSSEIDLLRLYIEMESLRFDNRFDYEIKVADNISTETTEVPSMLIQPYVENAIWHGLLHKNEKGKLMVEFRKEGEKTLIVTIDDNGIGRKKAAELKSKQVLKKKSYGMQISEDRIQIINRTQKIHATCDIIDKQDAEGNATGTTVKLIIPYQALTK